MSMMHAFLVAASLGVLSRAANTTKQPHIIAVIADDLGWSGVGFNLQPEQRRLRNQWVQTPVLDKLAAQGVVLKRHYGARVCAPSRSSFLSGRFTFHVNRNNFAIERPFMGVPMGMSTIADMLKGQGYVTYHVGKWHLGMHSRELIPINRGFTHSLGMLGGSMNYVTFESGWVENKRPRKQKDLWLDNEPAPASYIADCAGADSDAVYTHLKTKKCVDWTDRDYPEAANKPSAYSNDVFFEYAIQKVAEHDTSKPMFMFLAPQNVHGPFQIPNRFLEYYEKKLGFFPDAKVKEGDNYRRYGYAMVHALDETIGKLQDMLVQRGMWENTLFLFMSDNGGKEKEAPNFPLRGGKGGVFEGGVRVVSFVSGGFLPKDMWGRWLDGPMHTCDWFSTFSALAGVPDADKPGLMDPKSQYSWSIPDRVKKVDSLNMWPYLSGQVQESPRKVVHLEYNPKSFGKGAIIVGRWKYLKGGTGGFVPTPTSPDDVDPVTSEMYYGCPNKDGCLFDLLTDEREMRELHASAPHATVLKQLQAVYPVMAATHFQAHFVDGPDKKDITAAAENFGGYWGPFQRDLPAGAMTDRKMVQGVDESQDVVTDNVADAQACDELCGQGCSGWQFKPWPKSVKPFQSGKNRCTTFKEIWSKKASIEFAEGYISGIRDPSKIKVDGELAEPWQNLNELANDISQDDPSVDSGVFETCMALGQGSKEAQRLQNVMG